MRKPAVVLFVLSVAALAVVLVPAAGLGAKGGNGGGKPGGGGGSPPPTAATVNVSPNPAPAGGARVDITGCGYALQPAEIRIVHPSGNTEAYMDGVWADGGCLNPTYFLTNEPGTYTVNVLQSGGRRNSTQVLKASTTLTVV